MERGPNPIKYQEVQKIFRENKKKSKNIEKRIRLQQIFHIIYDDK